MQLCKEYTGDTPLLAAALLHDVLEDASIKKAKLNSFLILHTHDDKADEICLLTEELRNVFTKENYPTLNRKERKLKELKDWL